MRVLVCGGRNYCEASVLWGELDTLHRQAAHDSMIVIQGGARGADQMAREWCAAREVPYDNFPANWETFGRAAGPLRNNAMLRASPDLVLAFPGGRGTADMVSKAKAAGVPVRAVR